MPLIKHNLKDNTHTLLEDDGWTVITSADELPSSGSNIVVTLDLLPTAIARNITPLGVIFQGTEGELVEGVEPFLNNLSTAFVHFGSFANGTGFSTARLLRERYGFEGDIRACGHLLRDQFAYLVRCGINVVETQTDRDAAAWVETLERFSVVYQPALDSRPWAQKVRFAG